MRRGWCDGSGDERRGTGPSEVLRPRLAVAQPSLQGRSLLQSRLDVATRASNAASDAERSGRSRPLTYASPSHLGVHCIARATTPSSDGVTEYARTSGARSSVSPESTIIP